MRKKHLIQIEVLLTVAANPLLRMPEDWNLGLMNQKETSTSVLYSCWMKGLLAQEDEHTAQGTGLEPGFVMPSLTKQLRTGRPVMRAI